MLIVRYILLQPEVEGDISFATNRGHFISLLQIWSEEEVRSSIRIKRAEDTMFLYTTFKKAHTA